MDDKIPCHPSVPKSQFLQPKDSPLILYESGNRTWRHAPDDNYIAAKLRPLVLINLIKIFELEFLYLFFIFN